MQDNVTQADREAAATAYCKQRGAIEAEHSQILSGLRDDHVLVGLFAAHRLASTAQPEVKALVEALEAIKAQTSAEDDAGENYRWDDREGALDFAYATAAQALAAYHEAQT